MSPPVSDEGVQHVLVLGLSVRAMGCGWLARLSRLRIWGLHSSTTVMVGRIIRGVESAPRASAGSAPLLMNGGPVA
jgi:hypothetical protein